MNTSQCSHFLWLVQGQKLAHIVSSKEKFAPRKVAMLWKSCPRQGLAWTLGAGVPVKGALILASSSSCTRTTLQFFT